MELFSSFSSKTLHDAVIPEGKQIVPMVSQILSMLELCSLELVSPCNHMETDSCIMLHANHTKLIRHYLKIMIRTVDTDVAVWLCLLQQHWVQSMTSGYQLVLVSISDTCLS